MKFSELVRPEFQAALQELIELPLPILTAYKLHGATERVTAELSKFQQLHAKLIYAHGVLGEDGKVRTNEDGSEYLVKNRELFEADFNELLAIDVDIPRIPLEDLKDCKLSTKSLALLKPLIEA
jgi:hypothetical protein